MKLNLGCGSKKLEGYINIDLYRDDADMNIDLRHGLPYPDGSVEEIFASHIIEHFSRKEWPIVIQDWYRVLAIDGKIHLECPEISKIAIDLLTGNDIELSIMKLYGAQEAFGDGRGEYHKNGFTKELLRRDLEKVGLKILDINVFGDNLVVDAVK